MAKAATPPGIPPDWEQSDIGGPYYIPLTVDRFGVLSKAAAQTARRLLAELSAVKKARKERQ